MAVVLKYDYEFFGTAGQRGAAVVQLCNQDSVDGARELQSQGHNVVLHCMCNPVVKGGFYHLVGAQEEDIVRRSDYLQQLQSVQYPLADNTALYLGGVNVLAHGRRRGYRSLSSPFILPMIACAAVCRPCVDCSGATIVGKSALLMKLKIDHIFQTAHKAGHTAIVLSAFGCGGFCNPPEHVAAMFKTAIDKWSQYFDVIRFCILDEDNHPKSNYATFANILNLHKVNKNN